MRKLALRWLAFLALLPLIFSFAACGDDDDDNDNEPSPDDDDDDVISDDDDDDNDADDDDDNDDTTAGEDVRVWQSGDELLIFNNQVRVTYYLSEGRYSVADGAGAEVIVRADAAAYSFVILAAKKWYASALPLIEWTQADATNVLGEGMTVAVRRGGAKGEPELTQSFTLLDGEGFVLTEARLDNVTDGQIKVGAIYPLYAENDTGCLAFGEHQDLRVLTNGTLNYLDFAVPIFNGASPTLSNWSSLIYNQATGRSLMLGFLEFDDSQSIVYNAPVHSGEKYQVLQAVSQYDPVRYVAAGGGQTSAPRLIDFVQPTPHDALETYADRLKTWLGVVTWLEKHPEIGVPIGWNSWSGSGSSGGYGTDINEEIIVANMDFADRELRRWGMNYFQIDDGWETMEGDWGINEDRFPPHGEMNGLEWLFDRARNMGFIPGLWIAAFNAELDAQVILDHPEWFADPIFGGLFGYDQLSLDLTDPAASAHLADLMTTLVGWGAEWIKLDFAYRAVLTENWSRENITRGEFYRAGIQTIREAIGDDVFFLAVAIVGWHYGLLDGLRLTLDTMPVWEGESDHPYSIFGMFDNQGLKPMYRDSVRRYYLNNRLWINHPDLIFFRAHADQDFPPLTLNESQTFATSVALQGGIVKIGDIIVDLQPAWVDSLRRIMPVVAGAARPLDLMAREFPEVFSLPVDDFAEPYHVLGLLNWGINRDLTVIPWSFLDDDARTIGADFADLGLDEKTTYLAFEFWTQEYLGEASGEFYLEVPARSPRVVALRPLLDRPQFLGTNRHVLGGLGVIHSVTWNDGAKTLTGVQEGSVGTAFAPFTHQLTFHVPGGFTATEAAVTVDDGYAVENPTLTTDGEIATLTFAVTQTAEPKAGEQHPDVTWVLSFE